MYILENVFFFFYNDKSPRKRRTATNKFMQLEDSHQIPEIMTLNIFVQKYPYSANQLFSYPIRNFARNSKLQYVMMS